MTFSAVSASSAVISYTVPWSSVMFRVFSWVWWPYWSIFVHSKFHEEPMIRRQNETYLAGRKNSFKIWELQPIVKDENADKLVASIVSIAHGLGLEVVAEGVEEKHQVDHLIALGCEYLQGYYFSRPVPQSEVADILQKQPMGLTGWPIGSNKEGKQCFTKL